MNLETFKKLKERLISVTEEQLNTDKDKKGSYNMILEILSSITYENRKDEKGTLAHFVVDSYDGDKDLGADLIDFDNRL